MLLLSMVSSTLRGFEVNLLYDCLFDLAKEIQFKYKIFVKIMIMI